MATLIGMLASLLQRPIVYWISTLLIVLVALSRLYPGVYTPLDVICGGLIGIAWVRLINRFLDKLGDKQNRIRFMLIMMLLIIGGLICFPGSNYFKASGAALGFIAGYWIEMRYIRHEPQARFWKKLLPVWLISDFIHYFLMCVWVTIGAPFLFKRFLSEFC